MQERTEKAQEAAGFSAASFHFRHSKGKKKMQILTAESQAARQLLFVCVPNKTRKQATRLPHRMTTVF